MIEQPLIQKQASDSFGGNELYDIAILGAGPAGMSAALCAARAKYKVLLIDNALPGGETATAYTVDNYLGFPGGILGSDLAFRMEEHLNMYPIDHVRADVQDIQSVTPLEKVIRTELNERYRSKTIIIATGLEPKSIGAPFEKQFLGRGVSYFAQGDGASYKGQSVAVVGGGNCACYAATYLADYVDQLYLIHRSENLKAVATLKQRVFDDPKIQTIWNSEITEVFGVDKVEKIKVENISTHQHSWLDVKCVFVYVGRVPSKGILNLDLEKDPSGYLITDELMRTNITGVFAAGDCRSKQIRQIATAVSDGMIAAINAGREIEGRR